VPSLTNDHNGDIIKSTIADPPRLKGRRKGSIMIKDAEREYAAAALYDGGWRAADREQLIAEYELDADEADAICELLRIYEDRRTDDDAIICKPARPGQSAGENAE
jgi:hypothetical protein